jgi:hypothetical protein
MPSVKVELEPWKAPNFVKTKGDGDSLSIPVSELDRSVIHDLADAWLVDLYKKAGMPPDWRFE